MSIVVPHGEAEHWVRDGIEEQSFFPHAGQKEKLRSKKIPEKYIAPKDMPLGI